jgi:glycosyltransferase involved in cell wall biosynthesis
MPPVGATTSINPMWLQILRDTQQADVIVLNSGFVRETFIHQGWNPDRLRVIYWGVDDAFLNAVPPRSCDNNDSGPLRLLFAGGFDRRKGAETLMAALKHCDDVSWTLEIAGTVDSDVPQLREFLQDARVTVAGGLPRIELAKRMSVAEAFIFPSLAEGSARVVFEALAAGCYVITTPNTGSIVEDWVHGRLIAAGDPCQLIAAIREAATNRRRLAKVGSYNARLVRSQYRQHHYGDKLAALYAELLESKRAE